MSTLAASLTQLWDQSPLPCSFTLDGQPAAESLAAWTRTEATAPAPGGELRTITFTDPASGLVLRAEVRSFTDFPAVEWVLYLRHDGPGDSPTIANWEALDWAREFPGVHDGVVVDWSRGSRCRPEDFEALSATLTPHCPETLVLGVTGGRSSDGDLPYFNLTLQPKEGAPQGLITALGWTGGWEARMFYDGGTVRMQAGMKGLRTYLRPGEEIRSPRMLLMAWEGDRAIAQNTWRRLILAHYTPTPRGELLPVCAATWGTDLASNHQDRARRWRAAGVPLDVYWIDAGWYGPVPYQEQATVFNTPWGINQGNWWPSPECYPEGLGPVGEVVHEQGYQFLLWIEAEVAKAGTTLLTEHPEWFLDGFLVNLGDETARQGLTDLVSGIIEEAGLDWYRQDFNVIPAGAWANHDEPGREGITEIRYIAGLYAFWDELQRRHPGLLIDNCSSGGRRIDLETCRRSIPLWRTDQYCFPYAPEQTQQHTQGLAPWVPLSGSCLSKPDLYHLRSCYGAAIVIDTGCNVPIPIPEDWLARHLPEYVALRPYFTGDFYALVAPSRHDDAWTAWQFDRPDLAAGCAVLFRRVASPFPTLLASLRALDPAAEYDVTLRHDLDQIETCVMTGAGLAALEITLPEARSSLVVEYRKR